MSAWRGVIVFGMLLVFLLLVRIISCAEKKISASSIQAAAASAVR